MDLFNNTSFNFISIRSCLVSQPKNKQISNNAQLFNDKDLLPITFSLILPLNLRNKIKKSQSNPGTLDENWNFKVHTIKILLDSGASVLIVCKDVMYECHNIFKHKRINSQL